MRKHNYQQWWTAPVVYAILCCPIFRESHIKEVEQ
jgi:hypothetical protein